MSTIDKQSGFIKQAGILAGAGIICRIIGILYRSPLTGIIGDEGNGYYSSAYNIYTIILLVSSYSIPAAISKVIAGKLALEQYKNAHKTFRAALLYVCVVGGIASLFTFFGAGLLVQHNSAAVLRIFAPTIFLSGILGVLRGYFQAHGTMFPTSISQIVEQILNAAVSIGAAIGFIALADASSDTERAIYGASGSALGTGCGVLSALLLMFLIYTLNKRGILRRAERDRHTEEESYGQIFKGILAVVTPFILSTFIYNLSTSLNQSVYTFISSELKGMEETAIATNYGIFAGKAVVISNIPIALAAAMSSAVIPSIASSFAQKEKKQVRRKIKDAIRVTMLIAIPSAAGLIALARPVTQLLFPQKASLDQASFLLMALGISVIFYSLSTLTNAILQGLGKVNKPVINATIALLIQTVILIALLLYTDLGLYALAISMVIYSFLMCVLNGVDVRSAVRYKQEYTATFLKPLMASVLMGMAAFGIYEGVMLLLPGMDERIANVICLVPALILAGIIYFASVMALGGATEKDLMRLPKGRLLVQIGRRCYLLREEPTRKSKKKKRKLESENDPGNDD